MKKIVELVLVCAFMFSTTAFAGSSEYVVKTGDIFLEFIDKALGSPVLSFDTSSDMTNRILVDLIYKEYNKTKENISVELIATLFQGFILSIRNMNPTNEHVLLSKDYENCKHFRQLVGDNYTKIRNVETYAEMMHLSKKTVNQGTRKVVGLSAKQFIINRVVNFIDLD